MTDISKLSGLKVGAAVCGSFCTFSRAFRALSELVAAGCDVTPIMSTCAYTTDTRFGTAQEHAARLFDITGKTVLHEITTTEPIGPKKMFDVLLVHLCNQRPVVIAVSTNDALAGAAKNIGTLRNYRNFYFVPIFQDDPVAKPFSMISDFNRIPQTIEAALSGVQIQPMITTVQ